MKPATSSISKYLLLGVVAVLSLASTANAWWDGEWKVRKKIVVDTSASGVTIADPIGGAAVLIRLHDGNFQFGAAKEDGSDLRFVAEDDKTVLPYHIEKYDGLLNEAFIWVKIPAVKGGTKNTIWLYYSNDGPKAVRAEDAKGTYDADTALVYHFAERGAAPADSSGNGNNGQNAGLPSQGALIAGGLRFDGKASVKIAPSPSLAWKEGAAATMSAWVKPTALQPNAVILSRREGANGFVLGADNGIPFVEVVNASGTQRSQAGAPLAINGWHHLAAVAEGAKITLYVDGDSYATLAASLPELNSETILGGDSVDGAVGLTGELDELQISKTARAEGLLKLAAADQGGEKAAKLLTFGEDEQQKGMFSWLEGGYFGVIIKSLTFDGWVVIGILAVMGVISWWVMISKVSYLNGISKGNAIFMEAWKHVAADLTVLDHGNVEKVKTLGGRIDPAGQKAMRSASVYRIYHIGAEEIRHRLAADHNSKVLSARSIQAIRASLDGGLVRETQKISKLIVLLTICISGGPFLGLLGTVVGVMITFAAVAAAGEVNVNAIAPGIAAALLATVAGLAVAIPSLFGYNYILSRVKDATADMHVFIDEFIAKMAEFYSEPPALPNPRGGAPGYHRAPAELDPVH